MSSNKQNLDFYLPSLINNHKFQQIFYHHNKLIVYDSSSSKHKALVSPKAIQILQRPKTSASISSKLSNRLMQARSKASVEKYVATHKRILEERKKTETSYLPKKKYNRGLVKKTDVAKLETIVTEDQSIKRDQLVVVEGIQRENYLQIGIGSSKDMQSMEPEEKLMKEIIQKTHTTQRKSIKVSVNEIKSIDRPQSRKSINFKSPDQNNLIPLSGSRQKTFNEKSNKNPQSLRKSVTINKMDAQKTPKSNLSSFSNFSSKTKSKKVLNKQPQINKQNLVGQEKISEKVQDKSVQSSTVCLQKLFDPIYTLFGHKDVYKNPQKSSYLSDLEIPNLYKVLPRECFFSSQTEKRRSYIDSMIYHLQRKVHQQQDIIKHQDEQIHGLMNQRHQNFRDGNTLESSQISNLQLNSWEKQITNGKSIKLSSIQEEQNQSWKNMNDNDEAKRQQALKQEISSLNMKTLQNQSKCTISKLANETQKQFLLAESNLNPSNLTKLTKPKKLVLTSYLHQQSQLVEIQQTHLKRAQITKIIDKEYYSSVKGLYWVMINQKENAYLIKRSNQPKEHQVSQSLKYIKEFHKNRSQMVENDDSKNQEQRIFVDKEFLHEHVQMPINIKEQIHWLYFKPCPQSSVFPAQLRLPQHYINSENLQPSINALFSLLNCILNLNPTFIERLFEPTYNNVFSCWLSKNGAYEPIYIDGYLPYNGKLNSFLAYSQEFLWIGVLLKCCAKLLGGYDQLFRLNFDNWSQTILGRSLTKLSKPSYKQIKQWQQDEFQSKVIEYLAKHQQKHNSTLIVRHKPTQSLFLITGIKSNKIKLSHMHSSTKKLQLSLFEFIIDEHYEMVLFPETVSACFRGSEFQSYEKGNIVTYQMKVTENKGAVTICTQLSSQQGTQPNFSKKKTPEHEKRRILVYQIPKSSKKQKNHRNEMVLKYSSDSHPYTRTFINHQGISTLQMDLPELKRGQYKIFIECGKIKLNDYFESHSKTITKWLGTQDSWNQKISPRKELNQNNKENRKFRNVISVVSSCAVSLKGGRSLIVNDERKENEVIEDENFVYKQRKANEKGADMEEEYV